MIEIVFFVKTFANYATQRVIPICDKQGKKSKYFTEANTMHFVIFHRVKMRLSP